MNRQFLDALKKLPEKELLDIFERHLTEREINVLQKRLGINGYEFQTLEKIGSFLGINKERVRQIQEKSFRKLRHRHRISELEKIGFVDPFNWHIYSKATKATI